MNKKLSYLKVLFLCCILFTVMFTGCIKEKQELEELKETPTKVEKFNLDPEKVKEITLIPIIKAKGFGEFPAQEIVEKLGIKNRKELKQYLQSQQKGPFQDGVEVIRSVRGEE